MKDLKKLTLQLETKVQMVEVGASDKVQRSRGSNQA